MTEYNLSDLENSKSFFNAVSKRQKNPNGPTKVSSNGMRRGLTGYSTAEVLQGAAMYRPRGAVYDVYQQTASDTLQDIIGEEKYKGNSKLLPYDIVAAAGSASEGFGSLPSTDVSANINVPSAPGSADITNLPQSASGLIWPTNGTPGSPFGMRIHPISKKSKMHNGLDISAPSGTPTIAVKGGTVLVAYRDGGYHGGAGNYVEIDHGGGFVTRYLHHSQVFVTVGQTVEQGAVIGHVGSTGASTGPHLHFETRINGTPQDPMQFLPQR